MPTVTHTRLPAYPPRTVIAGLAFATLGMIVGGPVRSAQNFTVFLKANGVEIRGSALVDGLPEPPIEKSRTSLSPGTATAAGQLTGHRTPQPIRIVRSIRQPINKVVDQTLWRVLCDACRSGRPLPDMKIQGLSASGRPTTWALHRARIKTFTCPSDPASPSAAPAGGGDVAMEELTLSVERIDFD